MKNLYFFLLLFLSGLLFPIHLQAKADVTGRVIDKITKEPLSFSNVQIIDKTDKHPVIGSATSSEGRFTFEGLDDGDYIVNVSYMGYKSQNIDLFISNINKNYDLGNILMEEDIQQLKGAIIKAARSSTTTSLDKKVFHISDNISQAGGSILQAMRNLPGITVDQEGEVYLRGSDKVSILIDGKQSSLTGFDGQKGLDNISASNIESIEIINNPSVKYDANGMAGIINIIYKKYTQKGWSGDIGFNFGLGELSKRHKSLPNIQKKYSFTPKYNPLFSLNYKTEKVNFFIQSEGMFHKKVNSNEFNSRIYNDNHHSNKISQFLENRTQQKYNVKGGLDWNISKNDILTIFGLFDDEYHIDRGHVPYDYEDGTRSRLWTWAEDERTYFMNYNFDYRHSFVQPGHYVELAVQYTKGKEDELFPFTDTNSLRNSTDSTHLITKEQVTTINADYTKPLRNGKIELGGKAQLRNIPITYQILPGEGSILDHHLGKWSKYRENIYSLYTNYLFASKHFESEVGLRFEYSNIRYKIDPMNQYYTDNDSYHKFNLYPNIRLTYKINDNNRFSLFYNRRCDRPKESELRPFPKYDDPEILKSGNPYLRPQYAQSVELSYKNIWNNGSFYLSTYYKHIKDPFTRIYIEDEKQLDVLNGIMQNVGNGNNVGFEAIAEQKFTSWLSMNIDFNWYHNTIQGFTGTVAYPTNRVYNYEKTSDNTWNLKMNADFNLPCSIIMQASWIYYAPSLIPQGKIKSRNSFDLGIGKTFFHDKLELQLSETDLFNNFGIKKELTGNGFKLITKNYYETQIISIGGKYKF